MTGKQLRESWITSVQKQTEFLRESAQQSRKNGGKDYSVAEFRRQDSELGREVQKAEDAYRDWKNAVCARYEHLTLEEVSK